MDWDKLRIFHTVAMAGSFTRASELLNLSQSAVSRQIINLEASLDISLFHRHPRGLVLTEAGELTFQSAREIFSKLALTEALLNERRGTPRGPLIITVPVAFGSFWLAPRLKSFLDRFPDIHLKILFKDDRVDLAMREADVSLSYDPPSGLGMVALELSIFPLRIYASKEYLKKYGVPIRPEDLDHHRLIVLGESERALPKPNFLLQLGVQRGHVREPYLVLNNAQAALEAMRSGAGVAAMHRYIVQSDPNIVEILPDFKDQSAKMYMIYPEQLNNAERIKTFKEFIVEHIAAEEL